MHYTIEKLLEFKDIFHDEIKNPVFPDWCIKATFCIKPMIFPLLVEYRRVINLSLVNSSSQSKARPNSNLRKSIIFCL